MERFQELRDKARQTLFKADHMLTMTYPLIREPKILVSVANNILNAIEYAITAILEYEKTFKQIPSYTDTFEQKFILFKNQIIPRYGLNKDYAKITQDLREITSAHNKSPMEFARKSKFVICSDTYEIRTLTKEDLKKIIDKAKVFIEETHMLTNKNAGIFR